MSAAANKRTVFAVVSVLLFAAICIAGPAGGAQRDRVRPKAPTNPHVTAATSSSVTIAWVAAADNVGVVGYDVYLGSRRARVAGTSYVVRELACGLAYPIAVAAVDGAGNQSRRVSMLASSSPCTDTTPPSAPTGFMQSATSQDAVVIVWQPSADDVGVVSYGLYRELARVGSTSEPKATLTGLTCGSTDVVSIDAVDAAGNRSRRQQVYVEAAACPTRERVSVLSATAASDNSEWVRCAGEGQRCDFSGTSDVRYGANGQWTSPRSFTEGVACTNKVFGDPVYGVVKSCERRSGSTSGGASPTPTPQWSFCSREGSTCAYTGTREVRYGANGKWTPTRMFSNGVACNNKVFGDPAYGVVKTCESRAVASSPPAAPPPAPAPTPPDTSPPAKPILSIGPIAQTSATLRWQPGVDNVGVDNYAVWLDGRLVTRTTATSHTYTGLNCGTDYVLGLQVVDAVGNTSVLGEALWPIRTLSCSSSSSADTAPPTTPTNLGITSADSTSVRLRWSPSTDNVGVSGYDAKRDGALAATVATPAATAANLTCGTSYEFSVEAFDAVGNRSPSASVIGATTACSDSQAPTPPTSVTATSRTATSIALSWSAATDNVGVAGYGLYRNGELVGSVSNAPGIFAGLTCNTNYTLAVDAYDAAGNRSTKVTIAAGTTACADTTPPSTPAGLTASSVTQTGLMLSWAASTDSVGVAGYDVFRGGAKVATTTATTLSQTGLACATSYGFSVQAFDAAGNRSDQASVAVTTAACPTSPPSGSAVLAVSPSGNDSTCVRGDLSKPCASFNRAYQVAQRGDTVQVAAGNYGQQSISGSKSSGAGVVTFRGASGVSAGAVVACGVNHIAFEQIGGGQVWNIAPCDSGSAASNITLDGIQGRRFFIQNAQNVTIRGGEWGPSVDAQNQIKTWNPSSPGGPVNILIEGNYFHDYTRSNSSVHTECLQSYAGRGVTIRGNRFRNCDGTGSLGLTGSLGAFGKSDYLVENNFFERGDGVDEPYYAAQICRDTPNLVIRNNTWWGGLYLMPCDGSNRNARVVGNYGNQGPVCGLPNVTYSRNVWTGSGAAPCHSTDRTAASLAVVGPNDLHLAAGSAAINAADPADYPGVDIDGQQRPVGGAPDAGADERN